MSAEEINDITNQVVARIKEKYFLVEKTPDLSANFTARDSFIEIVILEVCKHFGITKDQLLSSKNGKHLECGWSGPEIKAIITIICRDISKETISFYVLGKALKRTHATIIYDERRGRDLIETNLGYRQHYQQILLVINFGK